MSPDINELRSISQKHKAPPTEPVPPDWWIEFWMEQIRRGTKNQAHRGENTYEIHLFSPDDERHFQPVPLYLRAIGFFSPEVTLEHLNDVGNLRGYAKVLYDMLVAEGFRVSIRGGEFTLRW